MNADHQVLNSDDCGRQIRFKGRCGGTGIGCFHGSDSETHEGGMGCVAGR